MNLKNENFRPITLRKGTVGGWSPRMRFDLVVNTMVKSALSSGVITVNNPNTWRPLIDVRDVCTAYIRAIESDLDVTGVYNISYDNYTIGRLADEIKDELAAAGKKVEIKVNSIQDSRNYKVNTLKARTELDFRAKFSPRDSVAEVLNNITEGLDLEDIKFYNIKMFKEILS